MEDFIGRFGTDDPRLGNLIKPFVELGSKAQVALVGFPHDEGVRRNGGRIGASEGPQAFRTSIPRLGSLVNAEFNIDLTGLHIADFGDISRNLTLEDAHEALKVEVGKLVKQGTIPFVIGGGNDQSYPNACGLIDGLLDSKRSLKNLTVFNIDAHLDVRPLLQNGQAHSGSPFRQLLQDPKFQSQNGRLIEFGCQGHQCSKVHWDFVEEHQGSFLVPLSKLRSNNDRTIPEQFSDLLNECRGPIFMSFDIDSIVSSDCPGVSCPASIGLTANEACQMCFEAGLNANVGLVDVSEFNPSIESYRTGRLVGLMFYYFLMGFSKRSSKKASRM